MSPAFQSAFNVVKGSVPARTDVPDDAFDDCGKKGMEDLAEANKNGTLFGSMAHGHAAPAAVKNAIYDVVTRALQRRARLRRPPRRNWPRPSTARSSRNGTLPRRTDRASAACSGRRAQAASGVVGRTG